MMTSSQVFPALQMLMVLTIIIVVTFRTSAKLGLAYGLAINFDFLLTTCFLTLVRCHLPRTRIAVTHPIHPSGVVYARHSIGEHFVELCGPSPVSEARACCRAGDADCVAQSRAHSDRLLPHLLRHRRHFPVQHNPEGP